MLKVMIDDVDDSEENGDGSRLKKLQQKLIAKRKDVGIEAGVKELLDGGTYVVLVPNDNRWERRLVFNLTQVQTRCLF